MTRFFVILGLILLTLGLVIWFTLSVVTSGGDFRQPLHSQSPVHHNTTQINQKVKMQIPGGPYEPEDPRWKWWNDMEKNDPNFEWKTLINFYGKVVDYDTGMPIEGAEVDLTWTDLSWNGSSERKIFTDIHGNFSMTNARGKNLGVSGLKKEGYLRSNAEQQLSFEYAGFWEKNYHQPDPSTPVIFRMKKNGAAESLVYRDTLYGLTVDNTPHFFDFKTGHKTVGGEPTGDLMLKLLRTKNDGANRWDWTLIIQGVGNTKILESSDEFMFIAPSDGYVNRVLIEENMDTPDYQSSSNKKYFVKLANGTFARIEMDIYPKYNDDGAVGIHLYLNPTPGHRNLEYDKNKRVKAP